MHIVIFSGVLTCTLVCMYHYHGFIGLWEGDYVIVIALLTRRYANKLPLRTQSVGLCCHKSMSSGLITITSIKNNSINCE